MPLKGEVRNRYMRDYMRRKRAAERAGSPKPAPTKSAAPDSALVQELKAAKARIEALQDGTAALKAGLARERSARAAAEAKHSKPDVDDGGQTPAGGPVGKKVFKILLKLDDANDNTVLVAARTLVSNLKANGSDLRTLADSLGAELEKQEKAKPAPPPNIDWPEVEAAVTRYAADRATVNFNKLLKALYAEITDLKAGRGRDWNLETSRFIQGALLRLGFKGSSSGLTWSR